jgi:HNH endonuclease
MRVKKCVYCGQDKPLAVFSDEHIWPDALGGNLLDPFWRTEDVCERCNNLSGLYVDGAFIKSMFGSSERAIGAWEYIDVAKPSTVILPLYYLGQLKSSAIAADEIAEYWAGPCGASILHIRPADVDDQWATYAGGNPRARKIAPGRAYMALVSKHPFWVQVSFNSFRAHFKRARRTVTNVQFNPPVAEYFKTYMPDPSDPTQARDMTVMDGVIAAAKEKRRLKLSLVIKLDTGTRMLAKLALGVGYKLFGVKFLDSEYASILRLSLWERDPNIRKKYPIYGTGYLGHQPFRDLKGLLNWPGGWVLFLKVSVGKLMLFVLTPAGKVMSVMVSDSPVFSKILDESFTEGNVWLTIPGLSRSEGPICLPDYMAHRAGVQRIAVLEAIEAMRVDRSSLPPCG